MSKTIRQFNYVLLDGRKAPIRTNSIVQICIDPWTKMNDGGIIISPHLMTEREIDDHIDALKEDLDAVGQKAKRALKKANAN